MLGVLLFFYGWLVLHRELLKGWLVVFWMIDLSSVINTLTNMLTLVKCFRCMPI